jgi:hypothetical protein
LQVIARQTLASTFLWNVLLFVVVVVVDVVVVVAMAADIVC